MNNKDLQKMFFKETFGQITVDEVYADKTFYRKEYVEWLEGLIIKNIEDKSKYDLKREFIENHLLKLGWIRKDVCEDISEEIAMGLLVLTLND